MDGVLFDTSELHFFTWVHTLQRYNIRFTHEMFQSIFGMKTEDFLATVFGKKRDHEFIARVSDEKEKLFREMSPGRVQLQPGVLDWLARLKTKGILQAVASSAPQANVDTLVDLAGIRPFFSAIISSAGLPGKPDPAVFLTAAGSIGVPAERCIVVEDAVVGVEAASRAGMKCIAVTNSNSTEALAAADLVVDRLDALAPDTFEKLMGLNGNAA
jgi:HAD superfamily hydrolase (TIGR01509 family)